MFGVRPIQEPETFQFPRRTLVRTDNCDQHFRTGNCPGHTYCLSSAILVPQEAHIGCDGTVVCRVVGGIRTSATLVGDCSRLRDSSSTTTVLVMASSEEVKTRKRKEESRPESQETLVPLTPSQKRKKLKTRKRQEESRPESQETLVPLTPSQKRKKLKKEIRSLQTEWQRDHPEVPRLNYGRGSSSEWKEYMDLMQPLDPFWGLFSNSDTMDSGQVDSVCTGKRACDWCVQAKGGGHRCSHVWIGCTRCIRSLLGRLCSYSTSDGGFAYPRGFDIDLARRRVLARFERVRKGNLPLAQAQRLSLERMGEENTSEWETEDSMCAQEPILMDFKEWRKKLLLDVEGGSKSNQISLLVLRLDFPPSLYDHEVSCHCLLMS